MSFFRPVSDRNRFFLRYPTLADMPQRGLSTSGDGNMTRARRDDGMAGRGQGDYEAAADADRRAPKGDNRDTACCVALLAPRYSIKTPSISCHFDEKSMLCSTVHPLTAVDQRAQADVAYILMRYVQVHFKKRAIAKNGSSRSILGQKRVGRSMKAPNTQFGLT